MKKVICENGHFYDADRFSSCPVCGRRSGAPTGAGRETGGTPDSEATLPLPKSSRVDELASTVWIPPEEVHRLWEGGAPAEWSAPERAGEPVLPAEAPGDQLPGGTDPAVWAAPDLTASSREEPSAPEAAEEGSGAWEAAEPEPPTPEMAEEESGAWEAAEPEPPAPEMAEEESGALESAEPECPAPEAAEEGGGASEPAEPEPPAPEAPSISQDTPGREAEEPAQRPAFLPVGWLVGLSGTVRGRIFPCKPGRNRIGGGPQMDVCIPDEPSIDPACHAQVVYEPKKRRFYLQAEDGDGLSYRNDELVFTHEELHAYDRITLGDVEFIFLPLCGDAFDWI